MNQPNPEDDNYLLAYATKLLGVIKLNRIEIIEDLEVHHVMPCLLNALILNSDDKERIENEVTSKDKAQKLLNIILSKSEQESKNESKLKVLNDFIESLNDKYVWLYDKLRSTASLADNEQDVLDGNLNGLDNYISNGENDKKKIQSFLESGGVQNLPVVTVKRHELLSNVRMNLRKLERGKYVVIQGMAGAGKTILAIHALHKAELLDRFSNGIFMLSIGKECSDSKYGILIKMRILCDKIGESRAPTTVEHGTELLRNKFLQLPQSLLILDSVWRPEVIRAFDIGCAIMVTTRDLSVMDVVAGRTTEILLLPDTRTGGFTQEESLELFKLSLGYESIDELPQAASLIHQTSQGSPMVISLISSLLSDHKKDNCLDEGRWNYYLDSLRRRKYSKMKKTRDYEHESVFDAISLSYDHLNEIQKKYYLDLTIFQDDVRIPCPVLEILWKRNRYEVEDIMKEFVRKSLVIEEKNPSRNWYVYHVNVLQLDYLKFKLHVEEGSGGEEKLHKKLVQTYINYCDSDWDKLPDDDYIYFYLGYHFYKAKMESLFSIVYLNLLFIGQKIRLTGPADLLIDLRKYREFIVNNESKNEILLEELQEFTQILGHKIYAQADVDIIQVLLEYSNFKLLYALALEYAKSQPKKLYFEWVDKNSKGWKRPEKTTLCSDSVRCLKFIGNTDNLFIAGLNNGNMELCELESGQICNIFAGHTGSIYSMDLLNGTCYLVSTSEDTTCKLWDFSEIVSNLESKSPENNDVQKRTQDSPSPKLRIDTWNFPCLQDQSLRSFNHHTCPVTSAKFSRDGTKVVSISIKELLIWNTSKGEILQKHTLPVLNIPCSTNPVCHFGTIHQYIIATLGNSLALFSHDSHESSVLSEAHNMNIVSLFVSKQKPETLITVSENSIGLWNIDICSLLDERESDLRRKSLSPRKSYKISKFFGCTRTFNDSKRDKGRNNYLTVPNADAADDSEDVAGIRKPSVSKSDIVFSSSSLMMAMLPLNNSKTLQITRYDTIRKGTSPGLFQCTNLVSSNQLELLACGTSDRKIWLYNLNKRQLIGEFSNQSGWIHTLEFSSIDDWALMSGSDDHTVMLWDIKDEIEETQVLPKLGPYYVSSFIDNTSYSEAGYFKSIISTDSNSIHIYIDANFESEINIPCPSGSEENVEITALGMSQNGSQIVLGTKCGKVYRIIETEKKISFFCDVGEEISLLRFDPTGEILVLVLINGDVLLTNNFTNLQQIYQLSEERRNIIVLDVYFPFGNSVGVVFANNPESVVLLQDSSLNTKLTGLDTLEHANSDITCSSISSSSSQLAIGTSNDGIIICNLRDHVGIVRKTSLTCNHASAITALKFSSDELKLAVGHSNGLITIWNKEPTENKFREKLNLIHHKGPARYFLFSPSELTDKQWLISCGDKLGFWSLENPIMDQIPKPSFIQERRRKKSGDCSLPSSRPSSRLSLELPLGLKIGKQGKRELLQSFLFLGNNTANKVVSDPSFTKFVTMDDNGIFYYLKTVHFVQDS